MEVKKKICKGTRKASGFIACGNLECPHKYGLCSKCFRDWLFGSIEGANLLQRSMIIGKKKAKTQIRRRIRIEKDAIKDWSKELQKNINKIARLIDKGLLCLARNVRGQIHAGHVYARGGNGQIKFNLHNIHRQSAYSNKYQNDDGLLREGLVYEYGQKYMDFISELRRTPNLKYSQAQYQELNKKALEITKRLKKADLRYELQERINLRNEINVEINIYDLVFCVF